MPYDQSLDVSSFKETKDFENTRITVGVFSYNEGEKKLQLSRENLSATGDWRFAKRRWNNVRWGLKFEARISKFEGNFKSKYLNKTV